MFDERSGFSRGRWSGRRLCRNDWLWDGGCGSGLELHNRPDEAVATASDGVEEAGLLGIVAENLADFADGGIDAVFGVDEDFIAPEAFSNFCASDDVAFASGEQDEQLHGLALKFEDSACTTQLEASTVQPKVAEFKDDAGHGSTLCGGSIERFASIRQGGES